MRPGGRLVPWLLVGPVLLLFAFFFAVPIALLLFSSVDRLDTATFQVVEHFTLHNYRRFLLDPFYLGVLGTTLRISVLVTLASLVIRKDSGPIRFRKRSISASNSALFGITNWRSASCAVSLSERPLAAALSFRRRATSSSTLRTRISTMRGSLIST